MTEPERSDELLATLLVKNIEMRVGRLEDASLTALHLALADQIVLMLGAGATDEDISFTLEQVWCKLGEAWERAGEPSEQTHRNKSAYVS